MTELSDCSVVGVTRVFCKDCAWVLRYVRTPILHRRKEVMSDYWRCSVNPRLSYTDGESYLRFCYYKNPNGFCEDYDAQE